MSATLAMSQDVAVSRRFSGRWFMFVPLGHPRTGAVLPRRRPDHRPFGRGTNTRAEAALAMSGGTVDFSGPGLSPRFRTPRYFDTLKYMVYTRFTREPEKSQWPNSGVYAVFRDSGFRVNRVRRWPKATYRSAGPGANERRRDERDATV